MAFFFIIGSVILAIFIYILIQGWGTGSKKLGNIPGPFGWPIIGNILQMDPNRSQETLCEWARKYGNIFKIRIFWDNVVVLNDYESIHQMLTSEACSSRKSLYRLNGVVLKGWKNIAGENFTPEWNETKKALSRSLNAYGTGATKIEKVTMESIDKLFTDILKHSQDLSQSIDIRPLIHMCVASIFTTLFYGKKLGEADLLELLQLERNLMKFIAPTAPTAILDFFPWMEMLPLKSIQGPTKSVEVFRKWLQLKKSEQKSIEDGENPEGILDTMMHHVNKFTKSPMTFDQIMGMTVDVILGGFVTSTASLYSLILILINYPEIQEKVYEEIQQITNGRRPQVSDRPKMSYVRAVMEESFRFSTILPLGVPHYTEQDTIINGKEIPRDTILFGNFWMLHHDEAVFDEPWKFKPERFLTDDGDLAPRDDVVWKHSLPFSTGRRVCPGEGLARNRTFLILTSLLQKYKFLPEDDHNIPSCDPREFDSGIVVLPYQYKVRLSEQEIL